MIDEGIFIVHKAMRALSHFDRIVSRLLLVVFLGMLCMLFAPTSDATAQSEVPLPDIPCRNCHEGSSREYVFPSGETIGVGVDVATLDASPHSSLRSEQVPCTACHTGNNVRYRYPHQPNPAQNYRDFVVEVSENCPSCHYPHKPFHPIEGADTSELVGELPTCADCHGSHDIERVESMADAMATRCIACHTDEDVGWADEFLAPRPGIGAGAEGYIGSTRCSGCHDDIYFTWRQTHHARFIQDAVANPDAVLGDFESIGEDVSVDKEDIAYTIGNRWRQAYLLAPETTTVTTTVPQTVTQTITQTVTQTITQTIAQPMTQTATVELPLLPVQWSIESSEWIPLQEGGRLPEDWITECGSCHVTGLNTETWTFTEFGVGCESCHGPGANHAEDPENVKPYAEVDDQVCGSCHSRGVSQDGYHFPATYRPGDMLADHFIPTTSDDDLWPDGSAKRNHQQYMDWQLGNSMGASQKVKCVSCHGPHSVGEGTAQLRAPLNDLCLVCHGEKKALAQHTPFHQRALQERSFTCADCHMPLMATSAEPYDIHNHTFLQPNPDGTIVHGGLDNMPNACNQCHKGSAESPQWATEVIAHAQSLAPEASFFGPGPTPTSPPPPTPMPSVGEVDKFDTEPPLWWVRWAAVVIAALVAAAFIAWIRSSVYSRYFRRTTDA